MSDPVKHETTGQLVGEGTAFALSFRTRHGFYAPHINSARFFAKQLDQHERNHAGEPFGPPWDISRHLATASIVLAFSAMEAVIDETEDDLQMPHALRMAIDRASFWDRCDAVLSHQSCQPMEAGCEPRQSAELLRKLRNALVHPKVEWSDSLEDHQKIGERIVAAGLPLSPFITEPPFPLGCMSSGIAHWAAETAAAFAIQFRERLGLKHKL